MMTEKCITFLAMGWNKRRAALTVALQIFTVALSLGGVIAYCIFQLSTHSTIEKTNNYVFGKRIRDLYNNIQYYVLSLVVL